MANKKTQQHKKITESDVAILKMVKKANTRLRQIEKSDLTQTNAYGYTQMQLYKNDFAYSKTQKNQPKFRTDISKMTYNQKKHLESQVNKFLNAKTSTVSGIKDMLRKQQNYFMSQTGVSRETTDEWLNLYDAIKHHAVAAMYGSDQHELIVTSLASSGMSPDKANDFLTDNLNRPFAELLTALDNITDMDKSDDFHDFTNLSDLI